MFEKVPNGDDYGRALTQVEKIASLEMHCKQLNEELTTSSRKCNELLVKLYFTLSIRYL